MDPPGFPGFPLHKIAAFRASDIFTFWFFFFLCYLIGEKSFSFFFAFSIHIFRCL